VRGKERVVTCEFFFVDFDLGFSVNTRRNSCEPIETPGIPVAVANPPATRTAPRAFVKGFLPVTTDCIPPATSSKGFKSAKPLDRYIAIAIKLPTNGTLRTISTAVSFGS
jgi:hypothetical protein